MIPDFPREGNASALLGLVTGFILGVVCNSVVRRIAPNQSEFDNDSDEEFLTSSYSSATEEHKMVFCVRTDLKMQKGKIAAQVGHATLAAYKKALRYTPMALKVWQNGAQPKIALQIRSLKQAEDLEKQASRAGLVTYKIYDAGETQVAAVSIHYPFHVHVYHAINVTNLFCFNLHRAL